VGAPAVTITWSIGLGDPGRTSAERPDSWRRRSRCAPKLDSREVLSNAKVQLLNIGTARTMWATAGLMALFYVAPGFATALFYKQHNELHFSTQTQGFLQLVAGISGITAAVGYGILCRRVNLRTLLVWCMLAATIANLGYLFYSSIGPAGDRGTAIRFEPGGG
jgi:hypothetical protein